MVRCDVVWCVHVSTGLEEGPRDYCRWHYNNHLSGACMMQSREIPCSPRGITLDSVGDTGPQPGAHHWYTDQTPCLSRSLGDLHIH